MPRAHYALLAVAFSLCISASPAIAQSSFIRFVDGNAEWTGELQTAISSYRNSDGITVDLAAAVHIADADYYEILNSYFLENDAVLYELVAEADVRPTPQSQSSGVSGLSFVQQALAGFLGVVFQLEHIDYTVDNFRHADLSPTELAAIMAAKNENFFTMFFSLALAQLAAEQAAMANTEVAPSAFTLLSMMNALARDDKNSAFKYLFAQELGRSDGVMLGPELEQQLTILGDRNQKALSTLEETLRDPQARRISLFFGAAHMPGIERDLLNRLGFKRVEQRWLSAWRIP